MEVGFLSRLKHPCIISFKDYFKEVQQPVGRAIKSKNNLYIIMEYANGGDLAGRITRQGTRLFDEPQVTPSLLLKLYYYIYISYIHVSFLIYIGNFLVSSNVSCFEAYA